jgi:transposase
VSVSATLPEPVVFVGIDVSSRDCWAAIEGPKPRRFKFDAASAAALAAWIRQQHPGARLRAVLEHTGVYSMAWAVLLKAQGMECALCNPAKVHFHAIAGGRRSKTDKADACSILAFALHYRPAATVEAPPAQRQLDLLVKQRDSIIKQRVALQNQLTALAFIPESLALVQQEFAQVIAALKQAEASLTDKMAVVLEQDDQLREASRLLRQMPGVGPVASANLCAMLDKILDCSPKQLTALCGLAPAHRQSGTSQRPSHIDKQGRARIRKSLYMAGLAASRCNPACIAVKQRLKARAKPGKVVIIAVARHLLLMAQKLLKANLLCPQPSAC